MFLCLQRCRCCDLPFAYEPHRASVRAGASLLLAAEVGALAHRRGRRRAGVGYARSTGSDREDAERETHDYNSTFGGTRFRTIAVDLHDVLGRSHCGSPMVAVLSSFYSALHRHAWFGLVLRAAVVDAPPARRALHQHFVAQAKRAAAASGSQVRGLVRASAALSVRRGASRAVHTGTPCQHAVARYLILGVAARVLRRLLASAPERRPRSPDPQRARRGAGPA